jgi:putative transposase
MARASVPIDLNESELTELTGWHRATSLDHRYVQRAGVILAWRHGLTLDETAARVGLSRATCNKWRRRFERSRMSGLTESDRPGRPKLISAQTRARIIDTARSQPPDGYTAWTQRRIAKVCGVSQTTVHDVLAEADLKPHKIEYWCGKPSDPEFETKMLDIIGLYLNPPDNAIVLCVDEKTQIQALDRTQPLLPMQAGSPKRLTATYTRHGTVSLIAALSVHTGEVTARTITATTSDNFAAFLKSLYRANPGKHIHVIADNLSSHKTAQVKEWAARRRRLTIHYTPTYSSWLNQVEIWFNILTRDVIKGGVWTSKNQLVKQLMTYVKVYTKERAKPFSWTYTGKPCKI